MSLQKTPIIMDDWQDVKDWSKQNAKKAAADAVEAQCQQLLAHTRYLKAAGAL